MAWLALACSLLAQIAAQPAVRRADDRLMMMRALEKEVTIRFDGQPVREFIEWLRAQGLNVVVDAAGIKAEQLSVETPISIELREVPLMEVIDLALGLADLGCYARQNTLVVTSRTTAAETLDVRCYDVSGLLWRLVLSSPEAAARFARGEDLSELMAWYRRDLIETIKWACVPESWDDAGGMGTINELGNVLVIAQDWQGHCSVRRLLRQLEATLPDPGLYAVRVDWYSSLALTRPALVTTRSTLLMERFDLYCPPRVPVSLQRAIRLRQDENGLVQKGGDPEQRPSGLRGWIRVVDLPRGELRIEGVLVASPTGLGTVRAGVAVSASHTQRPASQGAQLAASFVCRTLPGVPVTVTLAAANGDRKPGHHIELTVSPLSPWKAGRSDRRSSPAVLRTSLRLPGARGLWHFTVCNHAMGTSAGTSHPTLRIPLTARVRPAEHMGLVTSSGVFVAARSGISTGATPP